MDILIFLTGATISFSISLYRLYLECKNHNMSEDMFKDKIAEKFLCAFILWFAYIPYITIDFLTSKLYKKFTERK